MFFNLAKVFRFYHTTKSLTRFDDVNFWGIGVRSEAIEDFCLS